VWAQFPGCSDISTILVQACRAFRREIGPGAAPVRGGWGYRLLAWSGRLTVGNGRWPRLTVPIGD